MTDANAQKSRDPNERIRLLMVDDESDYLEVLANRLGRRGIDVVKAGSGSEGIRILREQDFDAALLDLKMEDMDGIEVLQIFRKMDPELKVIMLTGHGSEKAAREGVELGAFGYLSKPCELQELVSRIRDACDRQKGGESVQFTDAAPGQG